MANTRPTGYYELTTIVDGALDQTVILYDEGTVWEHARAEVADLRERGLEGQVYAMYHPHREPRTYSDCSCSQYEQDHRPLLSTTKVA